MNNKIEELVDGYLKNNIGVSEHFLEKKLSTQLGRHLLSLHSNNQLKQSSIGNNNETNVNTLIRNDKIYWLDRSHNNIHENAFLDIIDLFVTNLNETCYTGISGYEFHYALFEKGSFYKRHLDQFKSNNKRAFSMVFYLNKSWKEADGGELRIYHVDKTQTISPNARKCVFFNSGELEHEVLISHQPRMSITGWLTRD